MADTGYYLYGVIKDVPLRDKISGIDRRQYVSTVPSNGIAGIVSPVSLDEFGEVPLKQNLESLDWVRDKVFRHEGVVEEVMKKTTIIPMKFCTIFNSTERVLDLLKKKHDFFAKLLETYSGKHEWGVKIYCSIKPKTATQQTGGSGREYLTRKKIQQETVAEDERRVNASIEKIFKKLRDLAEDSRINRPTPKELLPYNDKEQVLNASFLMEETNAKRFTVLADELAEEYKEQLIVKLTGPLPIYSFIGGD